MSEKFTETFKSAITDIKTKAAEKGVSMRALCKEAGISRATPDRWLAKPPNSIVLVEKLQEAAEVTEPARRRKAGDQ